MIQANIRCCNVAGGNNGGNIKYNISVGDQSVLADRPTDITNADGNKQTSTSCFVTIACCIGDGCVAVAN
ncbi:hypothetical protein LTR16_005302 [Cryomyces antarcticus]|uniref:Hydrophobin n=1 Tax=Cryomyces antarcticus TaxID=329879 RepID=A0ABR0M5K4_9PEZI|nr:hypothetical protein LTR60_005124 [Cryomyces antarcticus]KAK5010264.1 hypothetical protein LTR39_004750 [Cryomyces antarcticus]KAK5169243.1 hypothetical protein LTR04_006036 [Oleoguttula sp. CCFEE 6159]KAK5284011.1 hypothetical protein LTR16_005302 [Cryomyces antarcticus]